MEYASKPMQTAPKTVSNSLRHDLLRGDPRELSRIAHGDSHEPHRVLGAHPAEIDGESGSVVRAFHPAAERVELVVPGSKHRSDADAGRDGQVIEMERIGRLGLYAAFVPHAAGLLAYRLRFRFADGAVWERDDP